ncbi:MAG: hypothetical protein ACYDHX_04545 [Methanothrix sp.]
MSGKRFYAPAKGIGTSKKREALFGRKDIFGRSFEWAVDEIRTLTGGRLPLIIF